MTKSQNTKSEQLTEQWEKGELPEGWYWVDYYSIDGAVMLEYIPQHNGFGYEEKEQVQAVLAEVPSYDELQNMNKAVNECMAANIKLVEQNAQLKELLKEMRDSIAKSQLKLTPEGFKLITEIVTKIDEVLNADKA